jgi:hypothetical protein
MAGIDDSVLVNYFTENRTSLNKKPPGTRRSGRKCRRRSKPKKQSYPNVTKELISRCLQRPRTLEATVDGEWREIDDADDRQNLDVMRQVVDVGVT